MRNTTQAEPLNPIHHVNGKVYRFDQQVTKMDGLKYNALMELVPNIIVNQLYRTLHKGRWKQVSTKKGNELHRHLNN
jgi:hypothetical protein